jgi:hypothetical protein
MHIEVGYRVRSFKLSPYDNVHYKEWGAWGWASRAGPGGGLGFEPGPKKLFTGYKRHAFSTCKINRS